MEAISVEAFTSSQLSDTQRQCQPHQWNIPGSKSITNRALVLAALSSGEQPVRLEGVLHSEDTRHMTNALKTFGIEIESVGETALVVKGGLKRLKQPDEEAGRHSVFVGNSGTTVRFLTSFACLVPGEVKLSGDKHMARRPIKDLVDGLQQMNVEIECETGCPPLMVRSNELAGGEVSMKGSKSSQYFTSLMMSAPYATKDTTIKVVDTLVSVPYVQMTIKMMQAFGAQVSATSDFSEISIKAQPYDLSSVSSPKTPTDESDCFVYRVEADASAASYAFAAAAVTGFPVKVPTKVPVAQSLQGDFEFVTVLEQLGCTVSKSESSAADQYVTVQGPKANDGALNGIEVDMFNISDTVMTLAAIAPLCSSKVTIKNVANIRIKETDRLIATVTELRRLGQVVEHGEDWFSVDAKPVQQAEVECYSDHRIAMSFAILGLVRKGITLKDKYCVNKTYPQFWDHLHDFQVAVLESLKDSTANQEEKVQDHPPATKKSKVAEGN